MCIRDRLNIITELGIEGGCNCQFALKPDSFEYAVIEAVSYTHLDVYKRQVEEGAPPSPYAPAYLENLRGRIAYQMCIRDRSSGAYPR